MRYELTDLRLFLAIAEAQSLSTGAEAVHITASAASYRIKNLEYAMGTPLFVRNARGMTLTPAGLALQGHVRSLLADIQRMHGDVGRFSAGLKGHIRLFANSSSLNSFIIPSLSGFLIANPNINIDLEERTSEEVLQGVIAGEADVGILAVTSDSKEIEQVAYAVDELVFVSSIDHPLARSASIGFEHALIYDFICMSQNSSNFLFLRDMAKKAGRQLNIRIHAHNFEAVLKLVEMGAGISLVPRSVALPLLRQNRLAATRIEQAWAQRQLNLITKAGVAQAAFVSNFVDFLLTHPHIASQ